MRRTNSRLHSEDPYIVEQFRISIVPSKNSRSHDRPEYAPVFIGASHDDRVTYEFAFGGDVETSR